MNTPALVDVYVAAGSNVEPVVRLRQALALLAERFGPLTVSRAFRNRAVGFDGPDFVNLVVGLRTSEPVGEVLQALHEIEQRCGRPGGAPKWEPRSMDLDILLYGQLTCDRPGLRLPRRDLLTRAYMLGPLAEIAPDVRHPVTGERIGDLWAAFDRKAHELTPVSLEV